MVVYRVAQARAFGEGNKRTALLLARWLLDRNGRPLRAASNRPRYHGDPFMHVIDYVIYGLWLLFWLGWMAAALTAKRSAHSGLRQFAGSRVALFVILVLVSRSGLLKGHLAIMSNPILQGIGMSLFLTGLGLALWARVYLGRNWGTPMSEKEDAELVTTGPYRYVRNPIYSGIILAAIGTAVAVSWYWLAAVVFMAAYFSYSANVEAHTMERLFPSEYPPYKDSTKMLVPFVF